jgi:hypothetical protein
MIGDWVFIRGQARARFFLLASFFLSAPFFLSVWAKQARPALGG